jgi:hypothetical protein
LRSLFIFKSRLLNSLPNILANFVSLDSVIEELWDFGGVLLPCFYIVILGCDLDINWDG